MKILVFDDNEIHRRAAQAQLGKDHDLTIVSTYDEAERALRTTFDREKYLRIMEKLLNTSGFADDFDPYGETVSIDDRNKYRKISDEATDLAIIPPDFDVVLTDLLVPASGQAQIRGSRLVGTEMPVGIFIGLLALLKRGVKYVAVCTDTNHHHHPGSACFDSFHNETFNVNGCKFLLVNHTYFVRIFDSTDLSKEVDPHKNLPEDVLYCDRVEEWTRQGKIVQAKDWAAILALLIKNKQPV